MGVYITNISGTNLEEIVRKITFEKLRYIDRSSNILSKNVAKSELFVVYLSGTPWCGSSGCNFLIFRKIENIYILIGKFGLAQKPIRVLSSTRLGYPEFGIWTSGGGIGKPFQRRVFFDGLQYVEMNEGAFPAPPFLADTEGEILIQDNEIGCNLYNFNNDNT